MFSRICSSWLHICFVTCNLLIPGHRKGGGGEDGDLACSRLPKGAHKHPCVCMILKSLLTVFAHFLQHPGCRRGICDFHGPHEAHARGGLGGLTEPDYRDCSPGPAGTWGTQLGVSYLNGQIRTSSPRSTIPSCSHFCSAD